MLSAVIISLHFSFTWLFVKVPARNYGGEKEQLFEKDGLVSAGCDCCLFFSPHVVDWRDAELMRDIEAATGEDLGSDRVGKKGKGKKKKKYPNLSDLKQSANTSRSRLEKKVFNKYVTSCPSSNTT